MAAVLSTLVRTTARSIPALFISFSPCIRTTLPSPLRGNRLVVRAPISIQVRIWVSCWSDSGLPSAGICTPHFGFGSRFGTGSSPSGWLAQRNILGQHVLEQNFGGLLHGPSQARGTKTSPFAAQCADPRLRTFLTN